MHQGMHFSIVVVLYYCTNFLASYFISNGRTTLPTLLAAYMWCSAQRLISTAVLVSSTWRGPEDEGGHLYEPCQARPGHGFKPPQSDLVTRPEKGKAPPRAPVL